jgi:hypothetical protein
LEKLRRIRIPGKIAQKAPCGKNRSIFQKYTDFKLNSEIKKIDKIILYMYFTPCKDEAGIKLLAF